MQLNSKLRPLTAMQTQKTVTLHMFICLYKGKQFIILISAHESTVSA